MQGRGGWERLRHGLGPPLLYAVAALFSFPAFGLLVFGESGLAYAHDVFDDAAGLVRLASAARLWGGGPALWDPYLTAGNSFLIQSSVPPLAPDALLAMVVGPFTAFVIVSWAFAFAAGLSMHLFLRDSLRLSTPAVVIGAAVFLFSFIHYVFGAGIALIPLLPWLSDRASVPGPRRWLIVLGWIAVATLMLYQGLSQTTLFAAGLQLVWTVATAERGTRFQRALRWAGVWALALALFAPILLPLIAALPLSQREAWILPTYSFTKAAWTAIQHYGSILIDIPNALRLGQTEPRYGALFMGAVGLPLLIIGIAAGRRDRRWATLVVLLVAIPVLDMAGMLMVPVQDALGPLATFQFWRIRHELTFVLVALVAIGADVLVGILERRRPKLEGRTRQVVLVGVGVIVALLVAELLIAGRPALHALRSLEFPSTRSVGWLLAASALALGLAIVAGAAIAAYLGRRGRLRSERLMGALLAVGVTLFLVERAVWGQADLLVNARKGIYGDPYVSTFGAYLGEGPAVAYLLGQPDAHRWRVLSFGDHANRMGFHGLRQVGGYQSVYPLAYHGLFGRLIAPQWAVDPRRQAYFEHWGSRAYPFGPNVDSELVRLVGARWLYVRGDEKPTVEGAIERFHDGDLTVYEVPDAFPRPFLAGGLRVAEDPGSVLDELAAADVETLRGNAFATTDEAQAAGLTGGDPGTSGTATIVVDRPDLVEVAVQADRPATLVLTDVMAPGWQAERDGQAAPIATVDGAFRGVAVSPDTRTVVFRYRPTSVYVGFVVALIAATLALVLMLAIRRRDRRGERAGTDPPRG